jgi:glutaredoxin-related protein
MAIDNVSKRASSTQMLLFFLESPPLPTGGFSQAIRQHMAHVYSGIASLFSGISILRQMLMHHGG